LQAATTANVGVNNKAVVTQGADVAQHGSARGAYFVREVVHGGRSVAAEAAHDGIMSESNIHMTTLALMVTFFGTV
jgi:hypothetical protein